MKEQTPHEVIAQWMTGTDYINDILIAIDIFCENIKNGISEIDI